MKKLLVLLFLTSCTIVPHVPPPEIAPVILSAEPRYFGLDILGLARQDIKLIKQNLEPGQCIGAVMATFGNVTPPMTELLKTGKPPCFRLHGSWCNHYDQCTAGECRPFDLPCMSKKAKAANDLAAAFPNSKCFYSPRLEYSSSNRSEVEAWFKVSAQHAPLCRLVASAMPGSYVPPGVLREKHGNNPGFTDITSNDGEDAFQSDSIKYRTFAKTISFWWTWRANLRLSSEKTKPPPPMQRPLSNRLRQIDILQLQLLQKPSPPAPKPPGVCKSNVGYGPGELEKVNPEDYSNNDAREKAPLLILRKKVSGFDFLTPNGKKIGCFAYYGTYTGGYHRYYAGNCANEDRISLYNKSGGEHSFAINNGQCLLISSIRRKGTYR